MSPGFASSTNLEETCGRRELFQTFTSIDILAPAQCEEICSTVHRLPADWTRINEHSDFFTLGAASYIEFSRQPGAAERYGEKARRLNPVPRDYFPGIMEHLRQTLERHFGEPAVFHEEFARPGFHIWLTDAIPVRATASVHFDLQYRGLGWPAGAGPCGLLAVEHDWVQLEGGAGLWLDVEVFERAFVLARDSRGSELDAAGVAALEEELGVKPDRLTSALYQKIRADQQEAPAPPAPDPNAPSLADVLGQLKQIQSILADIQARARQG